MSKSKVICFFSSSLSWGGLEMNLVRWASWLHDSKCSVVVFCRINSKLHLKAEELGVNAVNVDFHRKYYDVRAGIRLSKLFNKHQVSHVLFRDTKDMSALVLAKRFMNYKIKLVYFQGMQLGVNKRDFFHTIRFNQLDIWLTPLETLKNEVLEKTRINPAKVQVLPLAVDENFIPTVTPELIKEDLQIPDNKLLVGVIGRLDPGKCQDVFIKGIAHVIKKGISVHGLIIGDETQNSDQKYLKTLKDLISQLDLHQTIQILPSQSPIVNYMNALDILVMSSVSETFGMVTIEGLYLGKKIIGTDSGGTIEILNNGSFGLLVEPKNSLELGEAIIEMVNKPDIYGEMAIQGKQIALDKFSKASFVKSLKETLL